MGVHNRHVILTSKSSRRRRFLLPLLAVGGVTIALLTLLTFRGSGQTVLIGTSLDGNSAPDFTLIDYRDQTISLSDFRGQVVVLTFIYTNCTDVCPVLADNLREAYAQLPENVRDNVALIAITVDPERDTSKALRAFSVQHGLADNPHWYALRGDPVTLERVWKSYGIYPGRSGGTPVPQGRTDVLPEISVLESGEGHTDAIYLVDPEGRERVLMRSYIDPDSLAHNVKALVN